MTPPLSSLVVGERVVSRCEDGLLEAEYALFDRGEVVVATGGVGVHEQGYLTTAGFARTRLYTAGITSELARQAFNALRPGQLRALARSHSVLSLVDRLGPYEAFQGGRYHAASGAYAGVWLDLEALAQACPVRGAAILFQALHLIMVLEEVADDAPVRLLTARLTAGRRSNERTWREMPLEPARRLPAVLYAMRVPERSPMGIDDGTVRDELMGDLRSRSAGAALPLPRLSSLAALLASSNAPSRVPPSDRDASRTKPQSSAPPFAPVPAPLLVPDGGSEGSNAAPRFEDLRQHAELLRGEDRLRAVAHSLTMMASRSSALPEVTVLAARAWLAAGEHGYGRHLARQVAEEAAVPDSVRLMALEILELTPQTNESILPPPMTPSLPPRTETVRPAEPAVPRAAPSQSHMPAIVPKPIMILAAEGQSSDAEWAEPAAPVLAPAPVPVSIPIPAPVAIPPSTAVAPRNLYEVAAGEDAQPAVVVVASVHVEPATPVVRHTVELAVRRERPEDVVTEPPTYALLAPVPPPPESGRAVWAEMVEAMRLPEGLTEDMLPPGETPRAPPLVRVAMTRLSRELGRDYRLWYGTAMKVDSSSIELMQRHLRRRFAEVQRDQKATSKLDAELTRHGALFSEILARRLGAEWVEIPGDQPGDWVMSVPPGTRVWPVWRMYNFFRQRRDTDELAAFYADLQTRKPVR